MYQPYLSQLAINDTFKVNGEIYQVVKKPFGKWIDVKRIRDGYCQSMKSSANVEVVDMKVNVPDEIDEGIDGLL